MFALDWFNAIIGYIAAVLTVLVGVPQFFKTIRTKTVAAVSLLSFCLYYIGTVAWIVYVSITPNKWLPLGLTDIFSCLVLTFNISAIYYYSYLTKQKQLARGENVAYFFPKLTPKIFITIVFVLYAIYFVAFWWSFAIDFSFQAKWVKYTSLTIAFIGVSVVFGGQVMTTIKKRSTEGLSLGMILISLTLNVLWELSWWLRMVLLNNGLPEFIASDPVKKADAIEEFYVGAGLQMMGVIVFLAQTIAYIRYHDWSTTFPKRRAKAS